MYYKEKIITLRNGETALLRKPQQSDANEILEYMKICAGETDFLTRYPEDCISDTVERKESVITSLFDNEQGIMLACFIGNELAGTCQLFLNTRFKTKHRANVAIGIRKIYWGLGIGTAMFEEMIQLCIINGIQQIELAYIDGNIRGRRLYEKMGFKQVATVPNAYRLKNGDMRAEIIMIKEL